MYVALAFRDAKQYPFTIIRLLSSLCRWCVQTLVTKPSAKYRYALSDFKASVDFYRTFSPCCCMKVKCVSSNRSFVHERSSLNADMSMVVAALVPHVSGATSHVAFNVVTNRLIISALFPEVFVAFSLHRSFSFGTVKARSSSRSSDSLVDCCKDKIDRTDFIAFHRRYLLHVDANTFCQQFRYWAIPMTIRDAIFERVYTRNRILNGDLRMMAARTRVSDYPCALNHKY